jgi:hypothetical protein
MKQYTYTVYHILGIKIGCTTNLETRISRQGFTEYEILWQQDGDFDFGWVAGDKEIELQLQYFGKRDNKVHYQSSRIKLLEGGKNVKTRNTWDKNSKRCDPWKVNPEAMLIAARKSIANATLAASSSPNRASLKMYKCITCGKEIKGSGPAGRHAKTNNHQIESI